MSKRIDNLNKETKERRKDKRVAEHAITTRSQERIKSMKRHLEKRLAEYGPHPLLDRVAWLDAQIDLGANVENCTKTRSRLLSRIAKANERFMGGEDA